MNLVTLGKQQSIQRSSLSNHEEKEKLENCSNEKFRQMKNVKNEMLGQN